jgi:hypothetical protein
MTLDQLLDTACPIFFEPRGLGQMQQVGSGILLQIKSEIFLLTAAHVTDTLQDGTLHIPGKQRITPVSGMFAHIPVPRMASRSDDTADIAYFRLSKELREKLHPSLPIMTRDDIFILDQTLEGDLYTFAGFPWRKSFSECGNVITEAFTFTGGAVSDKTYQALGYSPAVHIVIRFRRKKSFSTRYRSVITAPHPAGISGGGVFAWPKDIQERTEVPNLKLVGIAHTYHKNFHYMAATRLKSYLACIFQNNPELLGESWQAHAGMPPVLTGVVWYKKEEWEELLRVADDADTMHATWAEWRQAALSLLEKFAASEVLLTPTEITVAEIEDYCRRRGIKNTGQARSELAGAKAAQSIEERPLS